MVYSVLWSKSNSKKKNRYHIPQNRKSQVKTYQSKLNQILSLKQEQLSPTSSKNKSLFRKTSRDRAFQIKIFTLVFYTIHSHFASGFKQSQSSGAAGSHVSLCLKLCKTTVLTYSRDQNCLCTGLSLCCLICNKLSASITVST